MLLHIIRTHKGPIAWVKRLLLQLSPTFARKLRFRFICWLIIRGVSLEKLFPKSGDPLHKGIGRYSRMRLIIEGHQIGATNFVETGTANGDTIAICLPFFKHLYSIEINEKLHQASKKRFAGKTKVTLLLGDSGERLADIIPQLRKPTIFWLDGHYDPEEEGDYSPIYEELKHILPLKIKKIILIDDAHMFVGRCGYPTLDKLKAFISKHDPSLGFEIEGNIIRVC